MTDTTTASTAAPRRWWVAALLAFFGFGAGGYLYVGRPRRAIVAAVVFSLFAIALWTGLGGWLAVPAVLFALAAIQLVVALFVMIDSARIARGGYEYVPRPYNRPWIYGTLVAASVGLFAFVMQPGVHTFSMSSASMQPTLHEGDKVIADTHALVPKRGAVVFFALPRDPRVVYVSRVMGLPGERLQMIDGVLQIDGAPLALAKAGDPPPGVAGLVYRETLPEGGSHLLVDRGPNSFADNTAVFEIPPDAYFVMGDNRDNATDSRVSASQGGVGYVPAENILGTATSIYWADDKSRIGMKIE